MASQGQQYIAEMHRQQCLMSSHCAELLALRRGTWKVVMGLAALLFFNTCFGVTGGRQGLVGEVAGTGLPWPGAFFATAPCSSTFHHEILVPPK